jgi:hypothetical protein
LLPYVGRSASGEMYHIDLVLLGTVDVNRNNKEAFKYVECHKANTVNMEPFQVRKEIVTGKHPSLGSV